jgi:hypothetical protein
MQEGVSSFARLLRPSMKTTCWGGAFITLQDDAQIRAGSKSRVSLQFTVSVTFVFDLIAPVV